MDEGESHEPGPARSMGHSLMEFLPRGVIALETLAEFAPRILSALEALETGKGKPKK